MSRPKESIRDYKKSDHLMLEQGQGFQSNLLKNLPDFTAKYPFIDASYAGDFQTSIDDANLAERDRETVEDISLDVSVIEGFMSAGKSIYMNVIHYAKLAYPNNPVMVNTFGHKDYDEYSRVHTLFPVILDQAFAKASDPVIKPLLLAKGLKLTDIAKISAVSESIKTEIKKIYDVKSLRIPGTQERITKYNAVWATMSELSECAKEIYSDNWAMYHMFLLYPESEEGAVPPTPPVTPVV